MILHNDEQNVRDRLPSRHIKICFRILKMVTYQLYFPLHYLCLLYFPRAELNDLI